MCLFVYYLRQEILRSVVFVYVVGDSFVGVFVIVFVNICWGRISQWLDIYRLGFNGPPIGNDIWQIE